MEIRPDRFKAVAAKTLGKIYGYVKSVHLENKQTFNVTKKVCKCALILYTCGRVIA